ncbi:hypothetical protein K488DRAFT_85504 [Vararia minispora EC-137]|uniref:Uncharacterized protein n=1 Tax=Vararia minispora EC-137 TaxID=1314806 RepID=A0ACB8QMG5_9AGAM|nr:hypothetical protein K488DRAFT_85504 [Vararia minispora EC-137]
MIYAVVHASLGFGLRIGSKLYLIVDSSTSRNVDGVVGIVTKTVSYAGTFASGNATRSGRSTALLVSMITGVLFLVAPVCTTWVGYIGMMMVPATISIKVGLFLSRSLVYLFESRSRKNAAIFSL